MLNNSASRASSSGVAAGATGRTLSGVMAVNDEVLVRERVIGSIAAHRQELEELGVRSIALFGSVARGDQKAGSDVDVLVEVERPAGLLTYARIENHLATLLGRAVDVVPRDSIREQLRARILDEAVRVF